MSIKKILLSGTALLSVATCLAMGPAAWAATQWQGVDTANWLTAGNWSPTAVPDSSTDVTINNGTKAAITVSGAETQDLILGDTGSGGITVSLAGTLDASGYIYLGNNVGSSGQLTIDGSNAVVTSSVLYNGYQGNGITNILNGGSLTNAMASLGEQASATGDLYVSGVGSTYNNTGMLFIGNSGTGTLSVSSGASATTNAAIVGLTGTGTVSISGAGTSFTGGAYTFGQNGSATLSVTDGATASFSHTGFAEGTGSTAFITLSGSGTTLESLGGGTDIGGSGNAIMEILSGASFSTGVAEIATYSGSVSSVTIDGTGSIWNVNGGAFVIGENGVGTLLIQNGGTATTSGIIVIGEYAGGAGSSTTVTGTGSTLYSSYDLEVRYGTLNILDGATVSDTFSMIDSQSGGTAIVNVDGRGSTWTTVGDNLSITAYGTTNLNITNGAAVYNADGIIDDFSGGTITVIVSDPGTLWSNSGYLWDSATLKILNGATVTAGSYGLIGSGSHLSSLTVSGAGSRLNIATNLIIGDTGQSEVTLSDGGTISAPGGTLIADQVGTTSVLNIGAAVGNAATAPGILDTPGVVMGPGTGTIVFNHTSSHYTFEAPISGTGSISVLSGKTILTGDSAAFSGATSIAGGTLAVNGSLGGALSVLANGRLQGSGTIGTTSVASGGTVAPGNSIGTLHVAGNLTLNAGSTYEVEANAAGASDQIIATGTITINGGTLALLPAAGFYTPGTTYTVLSAASGLSGRFDQVTSSRSWLFMEPFVSYEATAANVRIDRNATPFATVADTANEQAVARAIDGLSATSAVYDAFVNQTDIATARGALLDLSGDLHPSIKATLGQNQDLIEDAILNRLDETTPQPKVQTKQAAKLVTPKVSYFRSDLYDHLNRWKKKPVVQPTPTRFDPEVWAEGFGDWGRRSSNGNALSFRNNSGGGIIGADAALDKAWRAGFAIAYGSGQYDQANHAKGSSNSAYLSLFAAREKDNLALRFGVTGGWHDITTRRSLSFPGLAESLHADYNAQTAAGFVEGAYNIRLQQTTLSPFIRGGVSFINVPSFAEEGGAAALRGDTSSSLTGQTLVGLKARQAFLNNRGRLQAELGWKHLMGDITPNQRFRIDGSAPFTIDGAPLAADTLLTGFGVSWALTREGTLGLTYRGQWAASQADQSVRGFVRYAF